LYYQSLSLPKAGLQFARAFSYSETGFGKLSLRERMAPLMTSKYPFLRLLNGRYQLKYLKKIDFAAQDK